MNDLVWIRGLRDLVAAFPDKDQDASVLAVRGEVYRRELHALTDESWTYAVQEAIRHERWFPTVACLLDYASDAPEAPKASQLPEGHVTREEFRKGYETFKDELKKHGIDLGAVKDMEG